MKLKSIIYLNLLTLNLLAQTYNPTIITPFEGIPSTYFGTSVDLYNNYLVVGAPLSHRYGSYSGDVYGYKKINGQWIFDQKIKPDDINSTDRYGFLLLIGDTLYAGARSKEVYGNSERGAAYHFIKQDSLWIQLQKIIPLDTLPVGSQFGQELAVNDKFLIVSAELDRENGMQSGSVYVFRKESGQWVQHQKLFPENGIEYQRFGESFALNERFLFVGAPDESNENGTYAGAIYVYKLVNSVWLEIERIISPNGYPNEAFGRCVDVSHTTLAIGAPENIFSNLPGKVYIYDLNNDPITIETVLRASDEHNNNWFGSSFTLKGDSIIIGATGDSEITDFAGALYLFKKEYNNWFEKVKFVDSLAQGSYNLGLSPDMDYGVFVGGATGYHDTITNVTGAVYIFEDRVTEVNEKESLLTSEYYLSQNYPNPFNPTTKIKYSIPERGLVKLVVYDILGREITTLVSEEKFAGNYEIEFNAISLPSGIYFYTLSSGNFTDSKKLILLK